MFELTLIDWNQCNSILFVLVYLIGAGWSVMIGYLEHYRWYVIGGIIAIVAFVLYLSLSNQALTWAWLI